MSNPRQGEIHYVDLPDKGGLHYVMVVPETKSNWTRMTLVVPFTSQNIARHLTDDKGAFFPAGSRPFLTQDSAVPAHWMRWVPTDFLDPVPTDTLPQNDINRVLTAIANFLGIPTYMDPDDPA